MSVIVEVELTVFTTVDVAVAVTMIVVVEVAVVDAVEVDAVVVVVDVEELGTSAEAMGDPQPVDGSQPAAAEYPPAPSLLFPVVTSWKSEEYAGEFASCQIDGAMFPIGPPPLAWSMIAMTPAQSGVARLVPAQPNHPAAGTLVPHLSERVE